MKSILLILIAATIFSTACGDVHNDLWNNMNQKISSDKQITSFSINGYKARINGTTVKSVLPLGTSVTALAPVITHNGAAISPESETAQDFSNPVTYTVTATDGTTEQYTVSVTVLDAAGMKNANLSVLRVKKGKLQPALNDSIKDYLDAPIPFSDSANPAYNDKQSNSLIADPEILIATMKMELESNGKVSVENATEHVFPEIEVGPNKVTIIVTAADKTTTKKYTVNMYRAIPIFKTGAGSYSGMNPLEDGATQRGVSWPNPRFKDNENGTVTDLMTGLMWLKDAKELTYDSFNNTVIDAKSLNTTYGSNDWRLPNINEMRTLINYNIEPYIYLNKYFQKFSETGFWWTSTAYTGGTTEAYRLTISNGIFSNIVITSKNYACAVSGVSKFVPKTGQDQTLESGDDGTLQRGIDWPNPRFYSDINGTVVDNMTSLMWFNKQISTSMKWIPALEYVEYNINTGIISNYGFNDWTIPNAKEIETLSNFGKSNMEWLNDSAIFSMESSKWIWLSSHSTTSTDQARYYIPTLQSSSFVNKNYEIYVLPVRQAKIINY